MRCLPRPLVSGLALFGALAAADCHADPRVIVSATASPGYTQRKYNGNAIAPESYVVMPGHYFEGNIRDRSIEHMPFRRIAEVFAPELSKRQYWPARDAKTADLLIVVHWGTTTPSMSTTEMRAQTSPVPDLSAAREDKQIRVDNAAGYDPDDGRFHAERADVISGLVAEQMNEDTRLLDFADLDQLGDQITSDFSSGNTARLLGYTKALRQFGARVVTPAEEYSLRLDLCQMRYFIILRAYDLHAATPAARSRAVWTLHLNVSSPGNSFDTAVDRMSIAAVNYVGRSTDTVETVLPQVREGKVEIGPVVILGEAR